eukprot:6218548-Ditylum_brightwellii.AAC.1
MSSASKEWDLGLKRKTTPEHHMLASAPNPSLCNKQTIHHLPSNVKGSYSRNENWDIILGMQPQANASESVREGTHNTLISDCRKDIKPIINPYAKVNNLHQLLKTEHVIKWQEENNSVNDVAQSYTRVKQHTSDDDNADSYRKKCLLQEATSNNSRFSTQPVLRKSRYSTQRSGSETSIRRSSLSVTFSAPTIHLVPGECNKDMWYSKADERRMTIGFIRSMARKEKKKRARQINEQEVPSYNADTPTSQSTSKEFTSVMNCKSEENTSRFQLIPAPTLNRHKPQNARMLANKSKIIMEKPTDNQKMFHASKCHFRENEEYDKCTKDQEWTTGDLIVEWGQK